MSAGRGERFHISIFGKTNSGKSSLFNTLLGQEASIISPLAGTTTDPVHKNFELLDAGPVVFIDTAGFGDGTALAEARERATQNVIAKTDFALVTVDSAQIDYAFYKDTARQCRRFGIPSLLVFTKTDLLSPRALEDLRAEYPDAFFVSVKSPQDIQALLMHLTQQLRLQSSEHKLLGDLLPYGARIVLVVPIDSEAPRGRIIHPQVQVIREALDHGFQTLVVRDTELEQCLKGLNYEVDMVITDSQAFEKVAAMVPSSIYLTGFSVLFIRYKGDLSRFVEGLKALQNLKEGSRIAIAESCSHNISCEDIGRFKIPNLLAKLLGFSPSIDFFQGSDFPARPEDYALIIHCGACMSNRQTVLSRTALSAEASTALINYGVLLAHGAGILERSLKIFRDRGIL